MLEHPLAASVQCRMYRVLRQGLASSAMGSETALWESLQKHEGFRACRRRPLFAGETTTGGAPAFKFEVAGWLEHMEKGPLVLLQVSYLDAAGDVMRVRRRQVVREAEEGDCTYIVCTTISLTHT